MSNIPCRLYTWAGPTTARQCVPAKLHCTEVVRHRYACEHYTRAWIIDRTHLPCRTECVHASKNTTRFTGCACPVSYVRNHVNSTSSLRSRWHFWKKGTMHSTLASICFYSTTMNKKYALLGSGVCSSIFVLYLDIALGVATQGLQYVFILDCLWRASTIM